MQERSPRGRRAASRLAAVVLTICAGVVLAASARAQAADPDRFALFAGYEFLNAGEKPTNPLSGWKAAFSWRVMRRASLRIEVGGAFGDRDRRHVDRHTLLLGPEIKLYSNRRVRAFLLGVAGYVHERTGSLPGTVNAGTRARACIWSIGGGMDLRLTRRTSYRVEYLPNFFSVEWQNHSALSTGLVFRFGTPQKPGHSSTH